MASYPFSKIELKHECDLEPQMDNSLSFLDSMLTSVSLPHFKYFPKSALNPVPIHYEIELPIFYDSYLKLDQYITSESPINKFTGSHFYEIELKKECDPDSQICDSVQISESIVTPVLLSDLSNILESVLILIPIILELESPTL